MDGLSPQWFGNIDWEGLKSLKPSMNPRLWLKSLFFYPRGEGEGGAGTPSQAPICRPPIAARGCRDLASTTPGARMQSSRPVHAATDLKLRLWSIPEGGLAPQKQMRWSWEAPVGTLAPPPGTRFGSTILVPDSNELLNAITTAFQPPWATHPISRAVPLACRAAGPGSPVRLGTPL